MFSLNNFTNQIILNLILPKIEGVTYVKIIKQKHIPHEDSNFSLQKRYLFIRFERIISVTASSRYESGDQLCSVNLGAVVFFGEANSTPNYSQYLEKVENLYTNS